MHVRNSKATSRQVYKFIVLHGLIEQIHARSNLFMDGIYIMMSMLQSTFVAALRHRSVTDPRGVTEEIYALFTPRSRIFQTLSINDRTHLVALHIDLTIGPVCGLGPSTCSRTRRNLLPVGVTALGGACCLQLVRSTLLQGT